MFYVKTRVKTRAKTDGFVNRLQHLFSKDDDPADLSQPATVDLPAWLGGWLGDPLQVSSGFWNITSNVEGRRDFTILVDFGLNLVDFAADRRDHVDGGGNS